MSPEKLVTLPNHDEMLERLREVNPDPHLERRLYPALLEQAGRELNVLGIALMLVLAFGDYLKGKPSIIATMLYMQAPAFVGALVSDAERREEVKNLLQDAISAAKAR